MPKILKFKSCANGGEYNGLGAVTPTSYYYIGVNTPANIVAHINNAYATDPDLAGKVTGIGYGWQQFTIPSSGDIKFTVRGAAGGATGKSGFSINPVTGAVSGSGNRPGRGAKIVGTSKLKKGDILYMLVGIRGWCNNGADYGSGGGGASVVLKDNPSGTYTFAPLNRKVDILFVAGGGGGCYDSSFGSNYYGVDAVVTNGINTNGGTSSNSRGGAGLTGNGASGSGGNPAYSILSGTPSHTTLNTNHYGGWGGGGGSYDGGGSGGGYSGGSSQGNSKGGQGGTSYINPNLCTEISRGYATVEADSERNLTNPWTAYGFIELELDRDETKYILAKDVEGYKYFDGAECIDGTTRQSFTNQWKLIPEITGQPDEDTYKKYGKTIINNRVGLLDNTKFLVMSKEPKETINISGNINGALVVQNNDVSVSDISLIKSINSTHNVTNLDVRFALSKNNGKTWQTYSPGGWMDIDIYNKQEFMDNGWNLAQFNTIPLEDWNSYKAKTIRLAASITQNGANGNTILDNIKEIADLVGSWRHFKESEAQYEYISDTEVKITFLESGNYKVNYLDQLNSSISST